MKLKPHSQQSFQSAREPRRRVGLHSLIARTLMIGAMLAAGSGMPTWAAVIQVDTLADPGSASVCALRDAISAANTDTSVNGCSAGSGDDIITFSVAGTITLTKTSSSPELFVDSGITIEGASSVAISGGGAAMIFYVQTARSLTLQNLAVVNGMYDIVGSGGVSSFGSLTVTNSTFSNNSGYVGGAIQSNGTLSVANTTFASNTAELFGGAVSISGTATVTNSTFFLNGALNSGGGIFVLSDGTLRVANSTFSSNGGGFGGGGAIRNFGTSTFNNSIVADSCRNDAPITDGGNNIDSGDTCGFSTSNTDPRLDPAGLQNNGGPTRTIALCTGAGTPLGCEGASPAIDAGSNAVCAAAPVNNMDQRGFTRPFDGDGDGTAICDIGAFEHIARVPVAVNVLPQAINVRNSRGVIAVAILTTATFDAASVDFSSVRFGPNGAREVHGQGHLEDVDRDGDVDLVLHFRTKDTGIVCGQTMVSLIGATFTGVLIAGSDSIRTVGCR